jgi:hypothetical protein
MIEGILYNQSTVSLPRKKPFGRLERKLRLHFDEEMVPRDGADKTSVDRFRADCQTQI